MAWLDVRLEDIDHELNKLDFEPTLEYIFKNSTLLDVGCGKGTYLLYLKKHRPDVKTKGIDINPEYVKICKDKGLDVELMDANDIKYDSNSFDVITCFHVLEHLEDDRKVLERLVDIAIYRVILILPRFYARLDQFKEAFNNHYMPFYTPFGLKRLLKGFKVVVKKPHYNPTGVYESWLVVIDV